MVNGYALLDFGRGRRLEQWGAYRLDRPDPTAQGAVEKGELWNLADAVYEGEKGKGAWKLRGELPEEWPVSFDDVKLLVRLTPYKHTGVFPEQQQNWQWLRKQSKRAGRALKVLNLFAYTGGATVSLAKDGHHVTHVDSSKPAIAWAKDNAELNEIGGDRIRWMLEDAAVFVSREIRRGKKYDGIILDPPAFGHSPGGKAWRAERDLRPLLENCCELLSEEAVFLVLNGYARGDTAESFHRLLGGIFRDTGRGKGVRIEAQELLLSTSEGRRLSTGVVARCALG
jgi:23S rRNA (cytosine1962-C5)-methyltransferase